MDRLGASAGACDRSAMAVAAPGVILSPLPTTIPSTLLLPLLPAKSLLLAVLPMSSLAMVLSSLSSISASITELRLCC